MKIVIAMDSMKGSLTSLEAGDAVRNGILRAVPDAEILVRPMADGGEGTAEALTAALGGHMEAVPVTGPLREAITAQYGIAGTTALIDISAAAGLTLVPPGKRDPLFTTTYGVGEMIADAIRKGCRTFITGLGGSATSDGGIGMLQALGFGIPDQNGAPVPLGAVGLKEIAGIDLRTALPELKNCSFTVACDVTNPLCGENGASAVFGPQKGAVPEMIPQMDSWLAAFASLTRKVLPNADPAAPGAGAAGGLGFAFRSFLNARMESGADLVLRETNLEESIRGADFVITGEGKLDRQTAMGKAPIAVAALAQKHQIPVIAFGGTVSEDAGVCNENGIDAFFPILRFPCTIEEALDPQTASANLSAAAEQLFRLIRRLR